jgi:hypothetical protein
LQVQIVQFLKPNSFRRFRPVNEREKLEEASKKTKSSNASFQFDDQTVKIVHEDSKDTQSFSYDKIFWNPKTPQVQIITFYS